tara:strand:- start:850 stop:1599 length:750 start_codon:yes stop_codon:yes gene_type:complete
MSDQKPHVSPKEASQQQAMILDNQTSEAAISPAMNQNELAELIRANLGTETISTTAQKIGIRIYQKPYTVNKTEYEKDPITGKAKTIVETVNGELVKRKVPKMKNGEPVVTQTIREPQFNLNTSIKISSKKDAKAARIDIVRLAFASTKMIYNLINLDAQSKTLFSRGMNFGMVKSQPFEIEFTIGNKTFNTENASMQLKGQIKHMSRMYAADPVKAQNYMMFALANTLGFMVDAFNCENKVMSDLLAA